MELWQIWVAVALFFLLLEIFTSGFAVACFSLGALAAAIFAAFDIGLAWQLVAFAVISIVAFVTVRPFVLKYLNKSDTEKTNADALIGKTGRVSQKIDPVSGQGRVAIDGDDWKAVSENGQPIEKGAAVVVTEIDSIILTVKEK